MFIATIDGGTTNSRVYIWQDSRIISQATRHIGVRNTAIDNSNQKLMQAIHDALLEALNAVNITEKDLDAILASGMLTSNVGIMEIPHITAPVTINELSESIRVRKIPEIAEKPILFIPGIKNIADQDITSDNIADMDIMRGEETEAAGLAEYYPLQGLSVLILPGSHNKYIFMRDQQILGCITTIAGELLNSMTFDTILADSVGRGFAEAFNQHAFLRGVEYVKKFGFGHAGFLTRIADLFGGYNYNQAQNYLLGLLLGDDFTSICKNQYFDLRRASFIVCGKPVMQSGYACLLEHEGWKYTLVPQNKQEALAGYGAVSLAKRHHLL